jgi:hypothetical protein
MMCKPMVAALAAVALASGAAAQEPTTTSPEAASTDAPAIDAKAACVSAMKTQTVIPGGRRFTTRVEFPAAEMTNAFMSVAQAVTLDGTWKQISANKDIGIITAARDVAGTKKQSNLNIALKPRNPDGVIVEAIWATPQMVMVGGFENNMKNLLCDLVASAGS